MSAKEEFGLSWAIILILVVPYFLPTIIAFARRKSSAAGIFILNFFLGWTLIGWVGALLDEGVLTEEEFNRQKAIILG